MLDKKSILQKTAQVGSSTLMSRLLGLIREILMTRYLGSGAISDSFFTAFKIPNMLRKIFAEGALSASFIPTLVKVVRKNKKEASSLISLGFLFFEGLLLAWCLFIMVHAQAVLSFIVPGFSPEQIAYTVPFLRILMPFILLVSSSALLAGALQSVGSFFVPAFAPIVLNIVYILGLLVCLTFDLSATYLCYFIMLGGLLQFLLHLYKYLELNFSFAAINKQTCKSFWEVLIKFLPCLLTMSITEVSLFLSTSIASYLPSGSISLIYYAFRFMQIPLGIFAVAFSTILLPHFSRINTYAPKRLSYYLLETSKFIFWIAVPTTIFMIFFSEKIFHTMFLSEKFPIESVTQAAAVLSAFSIGLFFFSLNKIILNIYYAMHVTWIPTLIGFFVTILNVLLDKNIMASLGQDVLVLDIASAAPLTIKALKVYNFLHLGKIVDFINYIAVKINLLFDFISLSKLGVLRFAAATTITIGVIQTLLLILFLFIRFNFRSYLKNFLRFLFYYCVQLIVVFIPAFGLYKLLELCIASLQPQLANFFLYSIGYWLWTGPLCMAIVAVLYYLRNLFKVELYFLNDL